MFVTFPSTSADQTEMVVAAALYDKTAEEQLTTGLFDGLNPSRLPAAQPKVLAGFNAALNPARGGGNDDHKTGRSPVRVDKGTDRCLRQHAKKGLICLGWSEHIVLFVLRLPEPHRSLRCQVG